MTQAIRKADRHRRCSRDEPCRRSACNDQVPRLNLLRKGKRLDLHTCWRAPLGKLAKLPRGDNDVCIDVVHISRPTDQLHAPPPDELSFQYAEAALRQAGQV